MEASLRLFNGLGVQFGTIMSKVVLIIPRKSGGRGTPRNIGWAVRPASRNDFRYPIYDLTKKSILHL